PIMALAPGLFSITTVVPDFSVTPWATARANWSVALPGPNGTTNVMGFDGKSWAEAGALPSIGTPITSVANNRRRSDEVFFFIMSPREVDGRPVALMPRLPVHVRESRVNGTRVPCRGCPDSVHRSPRHPARPQSRS